MLLSYIRKIKKKVKSLEAKPKSARLPKVIWKQAYPEDAEARIQQAFEMLLSDDPVQSYDGQIRTTIDRDSPKVDNKDNERKIKQIINGSRSGREIASFAAVCFPLLKSKKDQRD